MSFDLKIEKGDISIGNDGAIKLVIDNDKLRQDIIKILLTELGENKFHPEYGSEVGSIKIGHIADKTLLESDLTLCAETAIRKLINLQKNQSKYQYLTPGEVIVDIVDISVGRDELDPRMYNIFISILTQKLTTIVESVTIRLI